MSIQKYKMHGRILELRLVLLYETLCRKTTTEQAMQIIKFYTTISRCNVDLVDKIIRSSMRIKQMKAMKPKVFKEHILFMGKLWKETPGAMSKRYFSRSVNYFRNSDTQHIDKKFIDEKWLKELDNEICILHDRADALEVYELLSTIDFLK